jgi:hypothetical protein
VEIDNVDSVLAADIGRSGSHTSGESGDRTVEQVDRNIVLNTFEDVSSAGLRIIGRSSQLLQASVSRLTISGATCEAKKILQPAGFHGLVSETKNDVVAALST